MPTPTKNGRIAPIGSLVLFTDRMVTNCPIMKEPQTISSANVIKLRNLCHSEVAQQPWESVFKRHYGLPRRFAPRNDSLNLITLPGGRLFQIQVN